MKKGTKILQFVEDNPKCRLIEISKFVLEMNHKNTPKENRPVLRGYYTQAIGEMVARGVLENINSRYSITELGKKFKKTPYKKTPIQIERQKQAELRHEQFEQFSRTSNQVKEWNIEQVNNRGYVLHVRELIAILKDLPSWARVQIASDEEINSTGDICNTVYVDKIKDGKLVTLFPINVRYN